MSCFSWPGLTRYRATVPNIMSVHLRCDRNLDLGIRYICHSERSLVRCWASEQTCPSTLEAMMPTCRRAIVLAGALVLPLAAAACSLVPTPGQANLAPTLSLQDEPGGVVAFESGQPVPTFDRQPRLVVDLDGAWRFDPQKLDIAASLTDRKSSLGDLTAGLGQRAAPIYDDATWAAIAVPGTFNPPPDSTITGGFYRHEFFAPTAFSGKYALLKFGAVRYVADVWLNGKYLGYHEGGDTPFSLDATTALVPGAYNSLAVRVDNPEWGTRDDIVPWGLADWWNYGGIVGDVWLEAMPAFSVVRADVTPHLDGADVSIVVQHRGPGNLQGAVDVRLWPAQVNASNALSPDAQSLIPSDAEELLDHRIDLGTVSGESVFRVAAPFAIRSADLWSPGLPALYVLQVTMLANDEPVDDLYTSFGLRQVRVDSTAPRVLLNGVPIIFNGVAMHEEKQLPVTKGRPAGGPLTSAAAIESLLQRAVKVHADLIRVDHHPPNQMLPVLADRLGTEPTDQTSANLDVAGFTMYYGVLYGGRLSGLTVQKALMDAHKTYPRKPIMVLEYGHWADNPADENQQLRVFNTYYAQLAPVFDTEQQGFIGAAVWWTLDDYWTQRPGITVETFGLYTPGGYLRKAGVVAGRNWARTAPSAPPGGIRSTGVAVAFEPSERHARLVPYLAYGFVLPAAFLVALFIVLFRLRRRAWCTIFWT